MLYLIQRRLIDFINPPKAVDLAKRELEEARRQLLDWEAIKEEADMNVPMLNGRIKRLQAITDPTINIKGSIDFGDTHAC